MKEKIILLKKRLMLYVFNVVIAFAIILKFFKFQLFPVFNDYGLYQCTNIATKIINYAAANQVKDDLKDEIVAFSQGEMISIDFNTSLLNSMASKMIKYIQLCFYKLESGKLDQDIIDVLDLDVSEEKIKKGIVYEIPISKAFNNFLIGNIGIVIPVRYQMIGNVTGQITSSLKEYGINSALLEINLVINTKMKVSVPMQSEEKSIDVSIPVIMKLIQGKIPDYFFGTSVLGEV